MVPHQANARILDAGCGTGQAGALMAAAGFNNLDGADLSPEMAEGLVATLTEHYGEGRASAVADLSAAATSAQGLVNCTPVGMEKYPGMPVAASDLRPDLWVADIVYFPLETELLAGARRLGCRVLPGSGMAVFQAVRAFELFTGRRADPVRMKAAFDAFDEMPRETADA